MKIDKENDGVAFNDSAHAYWDINNPKKEYISVTTLIGSYAQPFDSDFWSKYKALEKILDTDVWKDLKKTLLNTHRITEEILEAYSVDINDLNKEQQNILDEWEANKIESCERGTKIHSQLEHSFYNMKDDKPLQKFGLGGKFICKEGYTKLDLENGVYPEYLISWSTPDNILNLAGQIDLMVKYGNEVTIVDHKGLPLDTPIATENGFKTMAELQVGDKVFDKDGKLCNVTIKSEVHHNPCYKITFDNSESIIADCEHRWLISFSTNKSSRWHGAYREQVLTTEELAGYLDWLNSLDKKPTNRIPKIVNVKPIELPYKELPIDPYVLGAWLGDGSKSCGMLTQAKGSPLWDEIIKRGYTLGDNVVHDPTRQNTESRTILGILSKLRELNLINNKHIPEMYLRASYQQRLDLLRGLMDTDGYYHITRHRYVMNTDSEWQYKDLVKLLGTLGVKPTVFDAINKCNGKSFKGWNVCFNSMTTNFFLTRNQDLEKSKLDKCSFRIIKSCKPCEEVPTQCIAVDSPSHTYCFGYTMIPTHNTNEKIDLKGGFNSVTRGTTKMQYPLNTIEDCNYGHYEMQLSTYAFMLQQRHPEYVIKDLILNHYDHNMKNTLYHCIYRKDEVKRMLADYYKKKKQQLKAARRKPIVY